MVNFTVFTFKISHKGSGYNYDSSLFIFSAVVEWSTDRRASMCVCVNLNGFGIFDLHSHTNIMQQPFDGHRSYRSFILVFFFSASATVSLLYSVQ